MTRVFKEVGSIKNNAKTNFSKSVNVMGYKMITEKVSYYAS